MRDCKNCKHLIMYDYKNKSYSCEKWECKFEPKEQEPTTKNDLGVDCISRAEAIKCLECDFDITGKENMKTVVNYINSAHDKIVNLPRVKQEPFKPMVEIDLDYVIKQKYIEREVLDKIRAEIETMYGQCKLTEYIVQYDGICTSVNEIGDIADILQILDRYKAETEDTDGTNE